MMEQVQSRRLFDDTKLSEYCEFYGISARSLDDKALKYIESRYEKLDLLITGYGEMAKLNQEICTEFLSCDCDELDELVR